MQMHVQKRCFVISPIGDQGSAIRDDADVVLNHIIKPVAESQEFGFVVKRADEISKPGRITAEIITRVLDDDLVIAYLTGLNPNVFYELALRHAIRKPFIQIIDSPKNIPFDIQGFNTIILPDTRVDNAENCKNELQKQIQYFIDNPDKVESPIKDAITLDRFSRSGDETKEMLSKIYSMIEEKLVPRVLPEGQTKGLGAAVEYEIVSKEINLLKQIDNAERYLHSMSYNNNTPDFIEMSAIYTLLNKALYESKNIASRQHQDKALRLLLGIDLLMNKHQDDKSD